MIMLVWLSSVCFSLPSITYTIYKVEYNIETNLTLTLCYMDRTSLFYKVYFTSFYFTFIFIPTLVVSVVYLIIIKKLKRLNKFVYSSEAYLARNRFRSCTISKKSSKEDEAPEHFYNLKEINENNCEQIETYDDNKAKASVCVYKTVRSNKRRNDSARNSLKSKDIDIVLLGDSIASVNGSLRRKSFNHSSKINPYSKSRKSVINKRKLTITLCLISIAFFFCQLPIRCFQIFNIFYEFESLGVEEHDYIRFKIINIIFLFTKLLYFLHGMSNPIIYNLMSTKFRKAFKKVIFCRTVFNRIFKKQNDPKFASPLFD